ncbi:type II toxin-antitoxin system VapC family toxin [Pseudonocardia hispaniensis]|uniref:Type II toxin-antitoxin system VapC family toxin n=1 Tax=Pseudonocardia hispaniensis TaxID=904933 RepID=A0ABW1IYL0_9PSEU
MRLLVDSHVLLWWLEGSPRLSPVAIEAMANGANELFLSAATVWELAIKQSVGKLRLDVDLRAHAEDQGFTELPVTGAHASVVRDLPFHHKDPFDRMLVAQARVEGLTLVTADPALRAYDVAILPATS